jgi:release factor glutamine methyltransferase
MLAWMTEDLAGRGVDGARLDAELLLAHALGGERLDLYLDLDRPLGEPELASVRALVVRRRQREPVAYILGRREFWGRRLQVTPDVLVPRPETELLVELGLARVGEGARRILDLCTGSGAVAIALACERPDSSVDATDMSEAALAVARANAAAHAVDARVAFHAGDLFAALPKMRPYALVTANPPYIREGDWGSLPPDVREHEPRLALVAGPEGVEVHVRIAREAPRWLAPGGSLLVEVGVGQASTVAALFRDAGFAQVAAHRDLAGIERVVSGVAPASSSDQAARALAHQ